MSKGTSSISNFGKRFKTVCNELSVIGKLVDNMDKLHWFLCGLGLLFETFSTFVHATTPAPSFHDLISEAESHEILIQSIHGTSTPAVAFVSQQSHQPSSRWSVLVLSGRLLSSNYIGGRGRGGRHPLHCQLCRKNGHYLFSCPNLHIYMPQTPCPHMLILHKTFSRNAMSLKDIQTGVFDSSVTTPMTPSSENVSTSSPYSGKLHVIVGNGAKLCVYHIGRSIISYKLALLDVLVIRKLT